MVPMIRSMKKSVAAASLARARAARIGQMLSLCAVLVASVDSPALAQTPPPQAPVLTEAFRSIMPLPDNSTSNARVWQSPVDDYPMLYLLISYKLYRYDGSSFAQVEQPMQRAGSWIPYDADGPGPGYETLLMLDADGGGGPCELPPKPYSMWNVDVATGQSAALSIPLAPPYQQVYCSSKIEPCVCFWEAPVFSWLHTPVDTSGGPNVVLAVSQFLNKGKYHSLGLWSGAGWSFVEAPKNIYPIAAISWDSDGSGPEPHRWVLFSDYGSPILHHVVNNTVVPFPAQPSVPVSAIALFDPDGPGPETETIVLGGDVRYPLQIYRNGVWNPMGKPLAETLKGTTIKFNCVPDVISLHYDGLSQRLYATLSGAIRIDEKEIDDRVAYFELGQWALPVGARTTFNQPECYYRAEQIMPFDQDGDGPAESMFLIEGDFTTAGPHRASKFTQLSRFNSFVPFGESLDNHVHALAFHDEDGAGGGGPALYAGGKFIYAGGRLAVGVARWDGSAWQEVGGGTNNHVDALASYKGRLIAGGKFTHAGGKPAGGIAAWDGTQWTGLGPTGAPVRTLSVIGEHLYAGGLFKQIGAGPTKVMANRIARYDGTTWAALGTGINGAVNAIASYQGEIVAGGGFTMAGNVKAGGLAAWNGTSWRALGFCGAPVKALAVYNNELIAGGNFSQISGVKARRLARFNGTSWSPFANVSPTLETINALTVADFGAGGGGQGSRLFIGGRGAITSTSPHWLAVYDASAPPGTLAGFNETGKVFADSIRAIAFGQAGDGPASLLVGGHFNALDDDTGLYATSDDQPRAFLAQFIAGADAARLLDGNAGAMASHDTPRCEADCDANGTLDASDLACFHAKVLAHDPHADCNRDGLTNLDDLICFQTLLAIGC